ncbi:GFA family protein [Comamonas humi]
MQYQASCHCGKNAIAFEGEIGEVLACNCSMCRRRGSLLWFTARENLKLLTPEENSSTYTFHKHVIRHRFCPHCGIHLYGEAPGPQGKAMAAINIRCVDGLDLDAIPVRHYDGHSA